MGGLLFRVGCLAMVCGCLVSARAAEPAAAPASTATPPSTNLPPFRVSTSHQPVPGGYSVIRAFIYTETNRFSFVMPPNTRLQQDLPNRKVSLLATEGNAALSVRVVNPADGVPLDLKAEALRERVLARFTGGKILGEAAVNADGRMGPAFDVQWRSATGPVMTRAGYLTIPGGWLEFDLTAPPAAFSGFQLPFNQFLLSFRCSGKDGELKVQKVLPPE